MLALRQCLLEKKKPLDPWSAEPLSLFSNTDDADGTDMLALRQCSTKKNPLDQINPCSV